MTHRGFLLAWALACSSAVHAAGEVKAVATFSILGDFVRQVGLLWFWLGVGGLLFRTVHLFFIRDVQTGLVWMTKILTDPFHDIALYHKAPLQLLRGELLDPAYHGQRA